MIPFRSILRTRSPRKSVRNRLPTESTARLVTTPSAALMAARHRRSQRRVASCTDSGHPREGLHPGRRDLLNLLIALIVGVTQEAGDEQIARAVHSCRKNTCKGWRLHTRRKSRCDNSVRRDLAHGPQGSLRDIRVARTIHGDAYGVERCVRSRPALDPGPPSPVGGTPELTRDATGWRIPSGVTLWKLRPPLSAMRKLPAVSTATAVAPFNCAEVAGPPSPDGGP